MKKTGLCKLTVWAASSDSMGQLLQGSPWLHYAMGEACKSHVYMMSLPPSTSAVTRIQPGDSN
jgi:hypothetical protein